MRKGVAPESGATIPGDPVADVLAGIAVDIFPSLSEEGILPLGGDVASTTEKIERPRFVDRARFHGSGQLPIKPLTAEDADALKKTANRLGKLRRQLYGGAKWDEEITEASGR